MTSNFALPPPPPPRPSRTFAASSSRPAPPPASSTSSVEANTAATANQNSYTTKTTGGGGRGGTAAAAAAAAGGGSYATTSYSSASQPVPPAPSSYGAAPLYASPSSSSYTSPYQTMDPAVSSSQPSLQHRHAAASATTAAAAVDPLYHNNAEAAAAYTSDSSSYSSYSGIYASTTTVPSPPPPPAAFRPALSSRSGRSAAGGAATASNGNRPTNHSSPSYQHGTVTTSLLALCTWLVLTTPSDTASSSAGGAAGGGNASSFSLLTQVVMALALMIYCLDLANFRQGTLMSIWLAVVIFTVTVVWVAVGVPLAAMDAYLPFLLVWIGTCGFVLATAVACRLTLAMEWLSSSGSGGGSSQKGAGGSASRLAQDAVLLPRQLEATLHGWLPPLTAALVTDRLTQWMVTESIESLETTAHAAPYLFALVLAASMLAVGACPSSFVTAADRGSSTSNYPQTASSFVPCIPSLTAFAHSALLLLGPVSIHLVTCFGRIMSSTVSLNDWYDLVLVLTIPFLMHFAITWLDHQEVYPSPYGRSRLFSRHNAVFSMLLPGVAVVAAIFALQQRYLIAMSHAFSYRFLGTKEPVWLSTLYWALCTIFILLCGSLWGRKRISTNEPLLGEYHDDVVQLCLAAAGLFLGKACGLPWNFTPLPILASLGFTLWVATRMLRYLAIFLFVLHATGIVVFTYRFAGIDHKLSLPLPGVKLSLLHFGLLVCCTSIVVGLVAGLAVRSSGGFGNRVIKKFDVPGLLLMVYSIMLLVLEIALVKRPVPTNELAGVEYQADEMEEEETLYDRFTAMLTSLVLIGMAMAMKRIKLISARSTGIIMSLALGKAVAFYIDAGYIPDDGEDPSSNAKTTIGFDILVRALVASLLCIILFVPSVIFLTPVHVKSVSRRRSLQGGPSVALPKGTQTVIVAYTCIFLPLALLLSIPYVLYPLASVVMEQYSDEFISSSPIIELLGTAIALWGLACMNTLNYYLPDGGAEAMKKISALVFLVGTGVFFAAPVLTPGAGGAALALSSNPYSAMSSLGRTIATRGRSRNGAWGLLSAAVATLLAIAGPLELKERRSSTGRKDRFLLVRTMVFSLLFGSGVAWFIVMQSMSEMPAVAVVLVSIASLTVAFLGTIVGVMGQFLELSEVNEVCQIALVWMVLTIMFLPFTWFTQFFMAEKVPWFGSGGWLSTYLVVVCLTALCITLSLKSRFSKNQQTRGLSNLMCVLSWLLAVSIIFGRYGVAGLDEYFDVQLFFGSPVSVIGTIVVSPILFLLEGDVSAARSSVAKLSAASKKGTPSSGSFGLSFPSLRRSNQWSPPLFGTVFVFLIASIYAIGVRGSGLLAVLGVSDGPASATATTPDTITLVRGLSQPLNVAFKDLATLAENSMAQDKALAATAKLAGSSFWTAESLLGPLLHLAGVLCILPSLYLLYARVWRNQVVSAATVIVALPLNAVPILLCRGIPCLQAAATVVVAAGSLQALVLRQADEESKMRI